MSSIISNNLKLKPKHLELLQTISNHPKSSPKKLFILLNDDNFFYFHFLPIALEAQKRQFDLTIFAIDTGKASLIRQLGFRFIPLSMTRSGTNVFSELKVLNVLYRIFRKERPDMVINATLKPITYSSIAAKWVGIPHIINIIPGLGYLFINQEENGYLSKLVIRLLKYGLNNPKVHLITQNKDDMKVIQSLNVLNKEQCAVIKGFGVDIEQFPFSKEPETSPIQVLLPSRMLWDKGVGEYVEAARLLTKKYPNQVQFILAGNIDSANKAAISKTQLEEWNKGKFVQWIGFQPDMPHLFQQSHIVLLPSYREGLPKSLIEACAIGRPIITTDVPGCREVVEDGLNGFLVEKKNATALAHAIEQLILDKNLRQRMGKAGRKRAENLFDVNIVVKQMFEIIEEKL